MYIVGYYRGKGVGRATIEKITSLMPGKYCTAVLKKNTAALGFFDAVFLKAGGERAELADKFIVYTCSF